MVKADNSRKVRKWAKSTTPDSGHQWESDNVIIRHHKREPRGQPLPSFLPKHSYICYVFRDCDLESLWVYRSIQGWQCRKHLHLLYIFRDCDLESLWLKLIAKRWLIQRPCLIAGLYAKLLRRVLQKWSRLTTQETLTYMLLEVIYPYNVQRSDNLVRLELLHYLVLSP